MSILVEFIVPARPTGRKSVLTAALEQAQCSQKEISLVHTMAHSALMQIKDRALTEGAISEYCNGVLKQLQTLASHATEPKLLKAALLQMANDILGKPLVDKMLAAAFEPFLTALKDVLTRNGVSQQLVGLVDPFAIHAGQYLLHDDEGDSDLMQELCDDIQAVTSGSAQDMPEKLLLLCEKVLGKRVFAKLMEDVYMSILKMVSEKAGLDKAQVNILKAMVRRVVTFKAETLNEMVGRVQNLQLFAGDPMAMTEAVKELAFEVLGKETAEMLMASQVAKAKAAVKSVEDMASGMVASSDKETDTTDNGGVQI